MIIKREGQFVNMIVATKEGTRQNIPLRDVRGAISWPSAKQAPMYFGVFAQKQEIEFEAKPTIVLVTEYMDKAPMIVFKEMVVMGKKYECGHFYADLRQKNNEILGLFADYSRYHRNSFIRLEPADLPGDFMFGVGIIDGWRKSLEIPKESILGRELGKVSSDNLDEATFPGLNALRLLLSSLERHPWVAPPAEQRSPDPDKARRRWSAFT